MLQRILVVDEDPSIVESVANSLRKAGFEVATAATGEDCISMARVSNFALIILELTLPGIDGFAVCREVRRDQRVPIMILSARSGENDRVLAFELGVDDYVTKPFSTRELVVRVRAILRRWAAPVAGFATSATVGPLHIDFARYDVTVDQQRVSLTPAEYGILKALVQHPGRVFRREDLRALTTTQERPGSLRNVDVHVRHLRAKLAAMLPGLNLIETVWGAGYRLVPSCGLNKNLLSP